LARPLAQLGEIAVAGNQQALGDIAAAGVVHQQAEMRILIDDPDMMRSQHSPLEAVERKQIAALVPGKSKIIDACVGRILKVHHPEQCRLAGAGFADNAENFTRIDRHIDVGKRVDVAIIARNAAHGPGRLCHHQPRRLAGQLCRLGGIERGHLVGHHRFLGHQNLFGGVGLKYSNDYYSHSNELSTIFALLEEVFGVQRIL